jgi:hypothetical protein
VPVACSAERIWGGQPWRRWKTSPTLMLSINPSILFSVPGASPPTYRSSTSFPIRLFDWPGIHFRGITHSGEEKLSIHFVIMLDYFFSSFDCTVLAFWALVYWLNLLHLTTVLIIFCDFPTWHWRLMHSSVNMLCLLYMMELSNF